MAPRTTSDAPRCSAVAVTAALVLLATVAVNMPAAARASAIRPQRPTAAAPVREAAVRFERHRRDVAVVDSPAAPLDAARTAAATVAAADGPARAKRSFKLLKLKPLILLPAKVALGAGHKLVAGARFGAKAVGVGAKAVGAGLVGLKAVSKVAKVTVKAATALGVKAVLLNFLFHKINQVIDFKTRLLSNLDNKNRQQNAQFLSGVLPASSSKPGFGSIGNKDDDDFLASSPGDQQVLAQEQSKSLSVSPASGAATAPLEEDEVNFDANKVSLQVPDRLFGPSFTAVNGISQTIGTVIQNTANRLARLVDAIKTAVFRKVSGVSSISNSSGGSSGGVGDDGGNANANRGSRDTAADLDDGLESDPLDEAVKSPAAAAAAAAAAAVPSASKKRSVQQPATAAASGEPRPQ